MRRQVSFFFLMRRKKNCFAEAKVDDRRAFKHAVYKKEERPLINTAFWVRGGKGEAGGWILPALYSFLFFTSSPLTCNTEIYFFYIFTYNIS